MLRIYHKSDIMSMLYTIKPVKHKQYVRVTLYMVLILDSKALYKPTIDNPCQVKYIF